MSSPLEFRPLSPATGAEVIGLDFDAALTPESIDAWHAAFDAFQLLVFRQANLEPETQIEFLETLGSALIENEKGRAYQFVSNSHEEGILGDESFAFHSDHAFMPDPIDVISLYGLEIPEAGTETRFVNALAAARALPDDLRDQVGTLRARHIIDPAAGSGGIPIRGPRLSDDLPHAYHPILARHPRLKEPVLYVSEQQTDSVEALGDAEGRRLVEALFEHLYAPRFTYRHAWQEGDLVVWDNRALQHARAAVPSGVRRTLRRVSVGGTSVYAYFEKHEQWRREEQGSTRA